VELKLTIGLRSLSTSHRMCTSCTVPTESPARNRILMVRVYRVQVNLPAETGDMGVLANHVPSIEQLKPGLVEIIEESGGSKQFFRTSIPKL
jgi:hypothetical protein